MRRNMPERHNAHRQKAQKGIQHRAGLLLGMLFLRKSLPSACYRHERLRGFLSPRSCINCSEGARKGKGILESKIQKWKHKELHLSHKNNTVWLDKAA